MKIEDFDIEKFEIFLAANNEIDNRIKEFSGNKNILFNDENTRMTEYYIETYKYVDYFIVTN